MSRNKIKDLPDSEISIGFFKCHENAKNLMRAAESLHENGFIPFANSMLILAVEEEVKGQVIHGIIYNREFSQQFDLEPMFSKHEVKKEVAKRTLWIWENLARLIKQEGVDRILKDPEFYFEDYEPNVTGSGTRNDRKIEGWFNQMSTNRETGLYTDYFNDTWHEPSRINRDHYINSLEICKMLIGMGDIFENKLRSS